MIKARRIQDAVIAFSERHHALFAAIVTAFSFAITLFVAMVFMASLKAKIAPDGLEIRDAQLAIFHTESGTFARVVGSIHAAHDSHVHISRELVHTATGETLVIGSSEWAYKQGEQDIKTLFTFPMRIPDGEWCLRYSARHTPPWSMIAVVYQSTLACSTVEPSMHPPMIERYTRNEPVTDVK